MKVIKRIIGYGSLVFLTIGTIALLWLFFTESGTTVRYMMADTILVTQHRHYAKWLIGEEGIKERVSQMQNEADEMSVEKQTVEIQLPSSEMPTLAVRSKQPKPLMSYEKISGEGWEGWLVTINDPKKLRIITTSKNQLGETIPQMVKRTGAVAGINAGGFSDPNWRGNGYVPIGLVISGGEVFYNTQGDSPQHIIGIDKNGKMIAGKYRVSELTQMGIQEGVTFSPRFIVNGKGQIKSKSEGWGVSPRTVMGQRKDGAILFAVVDGRQTHSIGVTLYELQQLFLEKGVVIAANLDGGSSTIFYNKDKTMNKPCGGNGEQGRYLPTGWLVFYNPDQVENNNPWAGKDPKKMVAGFGSKKKTNSTQKIKPVPIQPDLPLSSNVLSPKPTTTVLP